MQIVERMINLLNKYLGNIECIASLIKYGCDVNLRDADGRPTLYILALENNVSVAKFLLEHSNINVNLPDNEGDNEFIRHFKLHQYVLTFFRSFHSFLIIGRTPLHVASWQGHLEMVELLVAQGKVIAFYFDFIDSIQIFTIYIIQSICRMCRR